jgi:flagellar hook protein FlgE
MDAAFSISVQAMLAQSTGLSAVSQNIANLNTTGYKAADVTFSDIMSGVAQPSETLTTSGGTLSAAQQATSLYGVMANERNLIDVAGATATTDRWNDLAIGGKGFFIVNTATDGSGTAAFTRDGSLSDKAVATTTVSSTGATTTTDDTYLTDNNGNYLMGWAAGADQTDSTANLTAVHYSLGTTLAGSPTSTVTLTGILPTDVTAPAATSVPVYDDQGNAQSINLTLTPASGQPDSWGISFAATGGTITSQPATTTLSFDGTGKTVSGTTPVSLGVTWADGKTTTISLDMSQLQQLAGGSFEISANQQDGDPPMELTNVQFNGSGQLMGTYSPLQSTNDQANTNPVTSKSVVLYTVPLATFTAPDSLAPKSGNLFTATSGSGTMSVTSVPDLGNQSSLTPGAVEISNVNEEQQFTTMIITQQAYNSAAQVVKTSDQMTQSVRDLIT